MGWAEFIGIFSKIARPLWTSVNWLRRLLEDLRRRRTLKGLKLKDNVYWRPVADGSFEGPFCPACRHAEPEKAVPMLNDEGRAHWVCPKCKIRIHNPNVRPPSPRLRRSFQSGYLWRHRQSRDDYRW